MKYEHQCVFVSDKGFCEYKLLANKDSFDIKDRYSFFISIKKGGQAIQLEKCADGNVSINLHFENSIHKRMVKKTIIGGFKNYVAAATYYDRVLRKNFPPLFYYK